MRLINLDGRLHLVDGDRVSDVEQASNGTFSADPQQIYSRWDEFTTWVQTQPKPSTSLPQRAHVGAPAPSPRQIFAVGLNYLAHADESGFVRPDNPVIFTKFASSITGPESSVELPSKSVDWEVELVVVLGRGGRNIASASAWNHVAGLTVGQDISERERQHSGPAPQFSLAKSHAGFSPVGPVLVTPDELDNPDDLELGAEINGEQVQSGRTSQLIFPVPTLIEHLSRIVELYPGDVIFTGTPAGVGAGRTPPRYLKAGDVLRSYITGIGEITQTFTAPASEHTKPKTDLAPAE
ncbi:fumarylacetoacetate hydrolase family protein [Rhodococcus sovatensis]|uniref:Fumarylacetoacetate hydrolase family protein n=1 Tax=Rhodococcus sovatensis TaxID=1805840 RepID=A0ABZ2PSH7_9NOCA